MVAFRMRDRYVKELAEMKKMSSYSLESNYFSWSLLAAKGQVVKDYGTKFNSAAFACNVVNEWAHHMGEYTAPLKLNVSCYVKFFHNNNMALSRQQVALHKESRLELAVQAYKQGLFSSYTAAATAYDVTQSTL